MVRAQVIRKVFMKKTKIYGSILCLVLLLPLSGRANYLVGFGPGFTAAANHLDHTGGNQASQLFPNPPALMTIYKWNGLTYQQYTFDPDNGWDPDPVLNPGEGFFVNNPGPAFTNVFTGTPHTPVLPVNLTPGVYYFLSDQTAQVGTYESIIGLSPVQGSTVYIYTNQAPIGNQTQWNVHTFSGGAWQPSAPTLPIGTSAFFRINTNVPPGLSLGPSNGISLLQVDFIWPGYETSNSATAQ